MYTENQIKLLAYNQMEKPDFTVEERNLYIGLAYCYEAYRAGHDKSACERLMQNYLDFFHRSQLREINRKEGDSN